MKDWKEYIPTFKEFFNTLAGKLTAILAFALLVIVVLSWFGAGIPAEFRTLVYIVVIAAMFIFGYQAFLAAQKTKPDGKIETGSSHLAPPKPPGESAPQKLPSPERPGTSLEQARGEYLDTVIADNRPLRLAGLDEHAGDPNSARLSLEKIYVALNTATSVKIEKKKEEQNDIFDREETRLLPVIEALQKAHHHRMVLLGLPGTGKSTFVRYLALMMAQELKGDIRRVDDWEGAPLAPMAISLGRFAESLPQKAQKGKAAYLENFI